MKMIPHRRFFLLFAVGLGAAVGAEVDCKQSKGISKQYQYLPELFTTVASICVTDISVSDQVIAPRVFLITTTTLWPQVPGRRMARSCLWPQ